MGPHARESYSERNAGPQEGTRAPLAPVLPAPILPAPAPLSLTSYRLENCDSGGSSWSSTPLVRPCRMLWQPTPFLLYPGAVDDVTRAPAQPLMPWQHFADDRF